MTDQGRARLRLVPESGLPWQVEHDTPGRLRIRVDALRNDPQRCRDLRQALSSEAAVGSTRTSARLGTLTIHYSPRVLDRRALDAVLLKALAAQAPSGSGPSDDTAAALFDTRLVTLGALLAVTPLLPLPLRYVTTAIAISPAVRTAIQEVRAGGSAARVQDAVALVLASLAGRYGAAQINNLMRTLARRLEKQAVRETEAGLRLMGTPPLVNVEVIRDGEALTAGVETLRAGDRLSLAAGDLLALDAMVIRGKALATTGFSGEEATVGRGDLLAAGSQIRSGTVDVILLQHWQQGSFWRLQSFIEIAIGGRESAELYANSLADRLVPYSVVVSGAVYGFTRDLARSSATLQADFGGPLSLVTPVNVETAIASGAGHGILLRGGEALESLARIDTLVFDKSGTLTAGIWTAAETRPAAGFTVAGLRAIFGRALLTCCRPAVLAGIRGRLPPVSSLTHSEVQQVTDQGLHLQHAGRSLGVVALDIALERFGVKPAAIPGDLVAEGCVLLCVLVDGDYAGLVRLENKPVQGAAQALEALRSQGIGQMHMITHEADNRVHPQLRELGFSSCQTSLDEVAKLRFIHRLIDQGRRVALVSDGLFQASGDCLNICLSNMPEARQLEADVWLIQPELRGIATALNLARHSSGAMRRNQRLNLAANGAVLLAGSFDLLSPTLAAILSNSVTLGMIREALHTREENTQ